MSGSALSLNRSFLLKIDGQTKEMILPNGPLQSFSRLCVELRVVSESLASIPASAVDTGNTNYLAMNHITDQNGIVGFSESLEMS